RIPDCHIPAIRRGFRRTLFCIVLQIPRRPARARFDRPTQLRTIRGNFIGNLRISLATLQRSSARNPPPGRFFGLQLKPRAPSWSGALDHRQAPLAHRFCGPPNQLARASFVLFIGAETTRYFTEAPCPNWLSNGL